MRITNELSPTFCLAKWYHTSIYLHLGQTNSCYHPPPHQIGLDEISTDPSALHNTLQKKKERAEMLIGERPDGCKYCWNVEKLGSDYISDRMIKTYSIYTPERFKAIDAAKWDQHINPEYIEVAFSNECNFKCGYCHPTSSSSYHSEIKQHGGYKDISNHGFEMKDIATMYEEDVNPYVQAWWEWWPSMSKDLNILRVTGGEPLMHRSTWRLFDNLRQDPKPQLELNVNSNLGVKSSLVEKLTDNVNDLIKHRKIKSFKLFSSMDSWGPRAEYMRTGLKLDLWEKNLDTFIMNTRSEISIMCTFNILSVTSFIGFLEKILEWRVKYNDVITIQKTNVMLDRLYRKVRFDTPYLKEPLQYDMHLLPKDEFLPYFDKILKFIDDNRIEGDVTKFSDLEFERFRRVRDYYANEHYPEEKLKEGRIDFYRWFTQYDKRRGVNFIETFPEMENFWNLCKQLSDEKQSSQDS